MVIKGQWLSKKKREARGVMEMSKETFEKYLEKNYPKPKHGYNYNVFNNFKKIWNHQQMKIQALEKEIKDYQDGWLGCCHTCEPVAMLNQALEDKLEKAVGLIRDLRDGVLQIPELSAENFLKDFEELEKGE